MRNVGYNGTMLAALEPNSDSGASGSAKCHEVRKKATWMQSSGGPDKVPLPSERTRVFISYSHQDKQQLERLQVHLKQQLERGLVDCWDDTKIPPGTDWL